jgi:hypothetical protein
MVENLQTQTIENQRKIEINMWLSKTFLKHNCKEYLAQLNTSILEKVREALSKVKDVRKVDEWRHYCGAKPRYWDIMINDDGTILFEGGIVWRAKIEGDILYTDGCVSRRLLFNVIDEGIRQSVSIKCRN